MEQDNPTSSNAKINADWEKCVLCQKVTSERLRWPFDSKKLDVDSWYENFGINIKRFCEMGCLPIEIDFLALDHDGDLVDTLIKSKATWHKSCRNKFSNLKLERAEKRRAKDDDPSHPRIKKFPRRNSSFEPCSCCFFCGECSGELHRSSTFNIDSNVRESAILLNDTALLAKLSAGDMPALDAMYHSRCLSSLYRRATKVEMSDSMPNNDSLYPSIVLAEVVSFIEESRSES